VVSRTGTELAGRNGTGRLVVLLQNADHPMTESARSSATNEFVARARIESRNLKRNRARLGSLPVLHRIRIRRNHLAKLPEMKRDAASRSQA